MRVLGARSTARGPADAELFPTRRRCRPADETGQAVAEMALILPLLVLLAAIAFTGWDALQQTVRLTTAARAGAIKAANDLSTYATAHSLACTSMVPGQSGWNNEAGTTTAGQPQYDATQAVNAEEAMSSYQDSNAANDNYVGISQNTDTNAGLTVYLVTITVSHKVAAWLPFVSAQHVNASATARYC